MDVAAEFDPRELIDARIRCIEYMLASQMIAAGANNSRTVNVAREAMLEDMRRRGLLASEHGHDPAGVRVEAAMRQFWGHVSDLLSTPPTSGPNKHPGQPR